MAASRVASPQDEGRVVPEIEAVAGSRVVTGPSIEGLLGRAGSGDEGASRELFELVYAELRSLASGYFRRMPQGQTLQPTALVHEVYLRLVRRAGSNFENREHFVAVAATAMRQILVDRERARRAQKRGGDAARVTLTGQGVTPDDSGTDEIVDLLTLDAALSSLAALSPRQARIVELLYFGGLTVDEAAVALGVSKSLVEKEWRQARAWLKRELASSYG